MDYGKATLKLGADEVALVYPGGHAIHTARVLGRQRLTDGGQRIWLDRLLHPGGSLEVGGCHFSGAVSTVIDVPPEAMPTSLQMS